MGESQLNNAIENFVAIPLIILIIIYMIACAIDPLLNINNQTFRILFTIIGGIPSLSLFFKKHLNQKASRLRDKTESQTCR
jgi:hypothetical protein